MKQLKDLKVKKERLTFSNMNIKLAIDKIGQEVDRKTSEERINELCHFEEGKMGGK